MLRSTLAEASAASSDLAPVDEVEALDGVEDDTSNEDPATQLADGPDDLERRVQDTRG